jgi:hypothetical protein
VSGVCFRAKELFDFVRDYPAPFPSSNRGVGGGGAHCEKVLHE